MRQKMKLDMPQEMSNTCLSYEAVLSSNQSHLIISYIYHCALLKVCSFPFIRFYDDAIYQPTSIVSSTLFQ